MNIVFMGTPDFAVPSLDILVRNGYNIVGVITAPDRPSGRGRKLKGSPVKEYAEEHQLKVLQPTNLKSPEFNQELKELNADLQVVVAFRMLPEIVWNMPKLGTFNLHASLLPNYRGAAPINWVIVNGEKTTGATTFFIRHEIDTGAMLFQSQVPVHGTDTAGDLHDRLMLKGAELVLKTVQAIEEDKYQVEEQDLSGDYPKAPKIFRDDCHINWNQPVNSIYNFIRGLSPYPTAWSTLDEKTFKVFKAEKDLSTPPEELPGTIITDHKTYIHVAGKDGYLNLLEVQIEGRKRMSVEEFLRGYQIQDGRLH